MQILFYYNKFSLLQIYFEAYYLMKIYNFELQTNSLIYQWRFQDS